MNSTVCPVQAAKSDVEARFHGDDRGYRKYRRAVAIRKVELFS